MLIDNTLMELTPTFYQDLEDELKEAGAVAGYELLVTAGEFDVARQKDQINDFIVLKAGAIIVSPCDSRPIGTAIKAANDAGIPVFTGGPASPASPRAFTWVPTSLPDARRSPGARASPRFTRNFHWRPL